MIGSNITYFTYFDNLFNILSSTELVLGGRRLIIVRNNGEEIKEKQQT